MNSCPLVMISMNCLPPPLPFRLGFGEHMEHQPTIESNTVHILVTVNCFRADPLLEPQRALTTHIITTTVIKLNIITN